MIFTLTTPCDECPFLVGSGFTFKQLKAHASGTFYCHKACKVGERTGNFVPRNKKTPHCAGALIFNERRGEPHQMMRIAGRLGFYKPELLDAKARVATSPADCEPERRAVRNGPRSIPTCNGNAGRIEGQHTWTRVGVYRGKYCIGCGRTRAELLKLGRKKSGEVALAAPSNYGIERTKY